MPNITINHAITSTNTNIMKANEDHAHHFDSSQDINPEFISNDVENDVKVFDYLV